MCVFHSSGHSRNCPTLRLSSPCRTPQSTGANFLPLIRSRCSPPPLVMAASPALPSTFTVLFWLLFPSCPVFLDGVMLWL